MNPHRNFDSQRERELRADAAMRAMHTEHRRLLMSAEGIQTTLQRGDDAEQIVDIEFCKILQRLAAKPWEQRSNEEIAIVNRLEDLAWKIADQRDYSDALDEEEMTRAEQKWEAERDCALLEPQA